jgi:hypothetical protein
MKAIRAVVADSGASPAQLCQQLVAAGIDPGTSLDVYRADGTPYFGVRTLREGVELALGFDDIPLRMEKETNMPDIPNLKQSAAPMPRTNKPPHVTPGSVETGADDDSEIGELVERLFQHCVAHDLPTDQLQHALEPLLVQTAGANGDAGVPSQRGAEDDEGLPDEVVKQVLEHCRGKISDKGVSDLEDLLRNGGDDGDPVPPWLKARKDEIERLAEPLDRHSASDMHEFNNAMDQMEQEARARMRELGKFDAPVRTRPAGSGESWHPGKGEPPGSGLPHPGGTPRPPGSLIPHTASDAAIARVKPRPFHKVIGVKKRHLPGVL